MRVGVIGRTRILLNAAKKIADAGYTIPFIYTCAAEAFYDCPESEFEDFAKSIGADFYNDLTINSPERAKMFEDYDCHVAVSMNWLTVLRGPACNAFRHGIWNAHAGDLPRYRGNACPNWAILNGEKRVGLCIQEMIPEELDSGAIVNKDYFTLTPDTYIGEIYDWMDERVPALFLESVQALEKKRLKPVPQSTKEKDTLRCYPRKPEDSRLDWNKDAETNRTMIRASSHPFGGGFCFLEDGTYVQVWKADVVPHFGDFLAVPGQVLYGEDGNPVIACANKTVLKITEATINGEDARPVILKSLRNRLL